MQQTITVKETVADNIDAEVSFSAESTEELIEFLEKFGEVDFTRGFFEKLPIIKADALVHNVIFDVKLSGKIYDWRLWTLRGCTRLYDLIYKLKGDEKYRACYGK